MEKFELYYPVKPLSINQAFGLNLNSAYKTQGMKGHNGIDLMATHGEPIYAAHGGMCYPEVDSSGGNGVVIYTKETYDYNGVLTNFKTIYWHLIKDDAVVKTGQEVKAGDLIGYANSTGVSTGDHLHFGLKPCLKGESPDAWANVEQNNGYFGAIDPAPYFNKKFAEDINGPSHPIKLFQNTLKKGMWNEDVKKLQEILIKEKVYVGKPDGIFGQLTLEAVRIFQSLHDLQMDGLVGPKTQQVLSSL